MIEVEVDLSVFIFVIESVIDWSVIGYQLVIS